MTDVTIRTEYKQQKEIEKRKAENPLRDIILGGQDGLVNSLGIILGISVATTDTRILITAVLAAAVAESISMGAVAYTSALTQRDFYMKERKKEARRIETIPDLEKEDLRNIYRKKGFRSKTLEEIVDTITADKNIWLDVIMAEELHLSPVNTKTILKSSFIVMIATGIGHIIALMPFFFYSHQTGLILSLTVSAVTLFIVGVYQAVSLDGNWWRNGIRMVLIGIGAALIGYCIANLFHTRG